MPDKPNTPPGGTIPEDGPASGFDPPAPPSGQGKSKTVLIDVQTIDDVLALLDKELNLYKPGTPEALALWRFREKLEAS